MTKVSVLTTGGCTYSWVLQPNTNVDDGVFVNGATSVAQCQSVCINNASCTGFDWNSRNCWMSGPWSGSRNSGRHGVTHYVLTRNCTGL